MEYWASLEQHGYPGYDVSTRGEVRRATTKRPLSVSHNRQGIVKVNLIKDERFTSVSVGTLVAMAFVPVPTDRVEPRCYNTVIYLDGDRTNTHAANLAWRPRDYAIQYHLQFHRQTIGFVVPIIDLETEEIYATSWDAATTFGLLDKEIVFNITAGKSLPPVWKDFALYREN